MQPLIAIAVWFVFVRLIFGLKELQFFNNLHTFNQFHFFFNSIQNSAKVEFIAPLQLNERTLDDAAASSFGLRHSKSGTEVHFCNSIRQENGLGNILHLV